MVVSVAYQNKGSSSSSSGSYTYTGLTLAAADHPYRKLLVAVASYRGSGATQTVPSGVTADGNAMTLIQGSVADASNHECDCSLWVIDFPTGADVDIVVTYPSANPLGSGVAVWALNGAIAWPKRANDIDAANGGVTNNVAVLIGDYVFTVGATRTSSNSRRFVAGESAQITADNASYAVVTTVTNTLASTFTGVTPRVNDSIGGSTLGSRAVVMSVSLIPKVPLITPAVGLTAGGTSVTIKGYGFTGAAGVTFGGNAATSIVVVDDETITCDTPAGTSGLCDVVIDLATDITLVDAFTYSDVPSPTFTSITPEFGHTTGGTAVTIIGDYFTGVTDVKFGGPLGASATSLVIVDDETMTMVTPAQPDGLSDIWIVNPDTGNTLVEEAFDFRPFNHVTQLAMLMVSLPEQPVRVTQAAILIINEPAQGIKLTQAPVIVPFHTTPIPLPLPIVPEVPVIETWEWKTVLNISEHGKEQRSASRGEPRFGMSFSAYILGEEDRRDVYQLMFKYIKQVFNYPMYVHSAKVDAAAVAGATKIYFDPTATDMRDGEPMAIFDPHLENTRYVIIDIVDSDGVTLTEPLEFDVPSYSLVCPAPRFKVNTPSFSMGALSGGFSLDLEGAQTRDVLRPDQDTTLTTIDGLLILDKLPLADGDIQENFDQNVTWLDNDIADPEPRTNYFTPFISGERNYLIHRPAGLDYWRAVASYMKGRQNPFLLPTFHNDLPLNSVPALSATQFETTNVQFFDFWRSKAWRYVRIKSDAGVIYRKINEVVDHYDVDGNPIYMTVKISGNIGAAAGSNSNMVISFANTCRLNSDQIQIEHGPVDSVISLKVRIIEE